LDLVGVAVKLNEVAERRRKKRIEIQDGKIRNKRGLREGKKNKRRRGMQERGGVVRCKNNQW